MKKQYANVLWAFSGASVKISFLIGVCLAMLGCTNIFPRFIVGTSSGSIIAFVFGVGLYEKMKHWAIHFEVKHIFKGNPFSFWGSVKAFWRVMRGHINLYDQSKLKETLKEIVSEDDYWSYKRSKGSPDVYVGVVDFETLDEDFISLKTPGMGYEEVLDLVLASSSIPLTTKPVEVNGTHYVDGGLRSHIGVGEWLERNFRKKVDLVVSVLSRPEDLSTVTYRIPAVQKLKWSYIFTPWKIFVNLFKPENFGEAANWVLTGMNYEISKGDIYKADDICKEREIPHIKIFTPYRLGDGSIYGITSDQKIAWYNLGWNTAIDAIKKSSLLNDKKSEL